MTRIAWYFEEAAWALVLALILFGCTTGPDCVRACAALAPRSADVSAEVRSVPRGAVAVCPVQPVSVVDCVSACALASCVVGCGR